MTKIINAYADGSGSIADSLKSLGESMFGNEARDSLVRENVYTGRRKNEAARAAADAYRNGNLVDYGANVVLGNPDSTAMGAGQLARFAATPGVTADNPQLQTLQIGHGSPYTATAAGERENIAQRQRAAEEATRRATEAHIAAANIKAASDAAIDARTMVPVMQNGRLVYMQKSQAGGQEAPITKDQAVGTAVNRELNPPAPDNSGAPPPTAAPMPAANPGVPKLSTLTPDTRHLVGLPTSIQTYVHPQTNQVVQSNDGGLTYIDQAGNRGLLQGSGFQPVPEGTALTAARDANVMKQAGAPDPTTSMNPAEGAAATDAAATTGILPAAKTHLNTLVGSIPGGPEAVQAVTGNPQIAPATQNARSDQDLRNNVVRSTIMGMPGRPSNYAQQIVDNLLPQGSALANPATEAQHVQNIVKQLRADRAEVALLARDPNTLPADRIKYTQHMQQIDRAIRTMSAPAGQMAGEQPAAAAPPAQRTIGQVYPTPKGPMRWMADGWHPAQ